jgi:unsaturated rhamnogalacturonyl hydrolase
MRKLNNVIVLMVAITGVLTATASAQKDFQNWPKGSSPLEVGKRVTERFLTASNAAGYTKAGDDHIVYPEAVAWYGALTFSQLSKEEHLRLRLIQRFDTLVKNEPNMIPKPNHVDNTVFAAVPLEIYILTKQPSYLAIGKSLADQQWANPTPDGLTDQTRFWIDDMYMITMAQVQAYRATGERKYIDRAALEMTAYLSKLQWQNGLFYHAPDAPFFWSRGNGWVAAGMAELLSSLPADHPKRARIMAAYKTMMHSLLKYQDKNSGMWHQLLDQRDFWPESSGTAMFTFALVTGVKNGWLSDKAYTRAARSGWLALVRRLEPNGDVRDVCEGTGKKNDLEYYRNRQRNTGDLHGQAPLLWTASAFLRQPAANAATAPHPMQN